ncbi:hypothetical protein [Prolixibacter sp. NT017]|uniref:hypothetical protein n=1 Tax=Prolixibacter sp. NT017 TaxID=2652390 RepID=UPI0012779D03|nr:hypothetical protein [Prolixibacter sp. NT017]GET27002.1 hypothetical protein NT017_33310 [Prolixibacter sp. NT017]
MKKLVILSLIAFFALGSAKVFAQSTGKNPYPGATHNYSVTEHFEADGTTPFSYTWKVYEGDHATDVTGTVATISGSGNSVNITWSSSVKTDGTYYLVEVTETDGASCSNTRSLPVQPKPSAFDLAVTGGNFCYDNAVAVTWDGTTGVTYDHGTATVTYIISSNGIGASETWSFNYAYSAIAGISGGSVKVLDASDNDITGTALSGTTVTAPAGAGSVKLEVTYTNGNTYDNTSAVDAQDFTETLTISNTQCSSGSIESDGTNNTGDAVVARPHTSTITAN